MIDLEIRPVFHWIGSACERTCFCACWPTTSSSTCVSRWRRSSSLIISRRPASAPRSSRRHSHPQRPSKSAPSGTPPTGPQSWPDTTHRSARTLTINEVALPLASAASSRCLPVQRPCRSTLSLCSACRSLVSSRRPHDEKRAPVFGKDHAQTKQIDQRASGIGNPRRSAATRGGTLVVRPRPGLEFSTRGDAADAPSTAAAHWRAPRRRTARPRP